MRLLLFLVFLVVPILEIWVLIQVGAAIGGWTTVGLLLADALLGSWLIRREGRRAWAALREGVGSGRLPDKELADGAMIVAGGTLLLAPGFLTDILGFALILPFTRPLMRRLGAWFLARQVRTLVRSSPYANLGMPFPTATAEPGRQPGQSGQNGQPGRNGQPGQDGGSGQQPQPGAGKIVTGEIIRED